MSSSGQPPYPPSDPTPGGDAPVPPYGAPSGSDPQGAPPGGAYGQPPQAPAYGQPQPYGQPPQAPQYGQDPNAYGQPYGQPLAPTGPPVLSIVAFVLSAIALLFVPILFGGAAIVCAAIGMKRNEKPAKIALIVAIVCTVLGIVIGAIVGAQLAQQGF